MTAGTLIVRADAGITMGTGHVMRCLALAQAWHDRGGNAVFAMAESTAAADQRLRSEGMKIVRLKAQPNTLQDAQATAALALEYQAAWVIIDGYQFDSEYQNNVKSTAARVLLVDDTAQCAHYSADLVLNHNVQANPAMYQRRETNTRLLLGPSYVLLRREFRAWRVRRREVTPVAKRLLIAMGGSDSENVTLCIIDALHRLDTDGIEITVVVGGSNPHWDSLRGAASHFGKMELRRDVLNMPELMVWADLAVSAGGGTCYELALLQVPMLLVTVAENQAPTCRALSSHGAAIDLGWAHSLHPDHLVKNLRYVIMDPELRQSLIQNASTLVDGGGAHRVVDALLQDAGGQDGAAIAKLPVSVE